MAITWRNVGSNFSPASASAPLDSARRGMNDAFNNLYTLLKDQQQVNQNIVERKDAEQLLQAQELLAGARTMEELEAARGQVQALRGGLRTESRTKLLGAEDRRQFELQEQLTKKQEWERQQRILAEEPVIQEYQLRLAQDPVAAMVWLEQNKHRISEHGKYALEGVTATRAADKHQWDANQDSRAKTRLDAEIKNWEEGREIQRISANAQATSAKAARDTADLAKAVQLQQIATEALGKYSAEAAGYVGSKGALEAVNAEIMKMYKHDTTKARDLMQNAAEVFADPANAGIPLGIAIPAVLGSENRWFGVLRMGRELPTVFRELRNMPTTKLATERGQLTQSIARESAGTLQKAADTAMRRAGVEIPPSPYEDLVNTPANTQPVPGSGTVSVPGPASGPAGGTKTEGSGSGFGPNNLALSSPQAQAMADRSLERVEGVRKANKETRQEFEAEMKKIQELSSKSNKTPQDLADLNEAQQKADRLRQTIILLKSRHDKLMEKQGK